MTTYEHHHHGIVVWNPMAVNELVALMEVWSKDYGYDIVDGAISQRIRAVMVVTSKEGARKWRDEIFQKIDHTDPEDVRIKSWINSEHTGLSSVTIWATLSGNKLDRDRGEIPYDPDDFSRCHKLLQLIPSWYERLQEVADKYPRWQPLVDHWHELESLYEEETKAGVKGKNGGVMMPRLYKRMDELRKSYKPSPISPGDELPAKSDENSDLSATTPEA